ncbi:MAG: anthranilate synthase component I family protein [Candidatus Saccharimonas sp.]|nr:anthranilate synthase component I family protein [Planctomycetaceae bacterium]
MNVSSVLPLVEELVPAPDVMWAVRAVSDWPHLLLLDSALQREPVGRFSFLMADPVETWTLNEAKFDDDPFAALRPVLDRWRCDAVPELPPFQGGIAGLMGYELGRCWERVPAARHDEFQLPILAAGLYDWVIAWDHRSRRAWLISNGWPENDEARRRERAAARMQLVREALAGLRPVAEQKTPHPLPTTEAAVPKPGRGDWDEMLAPLPLVEQFDVPGLPGLTSNFSRDDYLKAVARVIEYIRAGDIFQANLTQRLLAPAGDGSLDLYERLRQVNPAPFAGLMRWDDWAVVSASPERFLRVDGHDVETRPIKGTRRRKRGPEADLFTRDELRESEKDQAENVMIVDLLRNDLSRVCEAGSIRVPQLCGVETYETVQHLVSEVRGRLHDGASVWDLFRVTLPGGSISGAPKIRAMEIIAELEPTARGPYCGSLFYVGANGQSDSNLLIRTFVERHGWLQLGVGGGIVAQSDPAAEYEETLIKAAGMVRALR